MKKRTISIESWDPSYGSPGLDAGIEPSQAGIDTSVEVKEKSWRPIGVPSTVSPASRLLFVDGVRRIEAIVWISDGETSKRGLCASIAAGVVEASSTAEVKSATVRRGLFSAVDGASLETRAGLFESVRVAGEEIEKLIIGVQQRLGQLEISVAQSLRKDADLIVVDGPLTGRQMVPGAIGYVKTHRVSYLPESLARVVGELKPGERTPVFLSTTSWTRYSWYMRLPGPIAHSWSGVVRLEAAGEADLPTVIHLAELAASTLPRFASVPHKDPRAPQNLFPIAGLERGLKHLLGEQLFVERALRLAVSSKPSP